MQFHLVVFATAVMLFGSSNSATADANPDETFQTTPTLGKAVQLNYVKRSLRSDDEKVSVDAVDSLQANEERMGVKNFLMTADIAPLRHEARQAIQKALNEKALKEDIVATILRKQVQEEKKASNQATVAKESPSTPKAKKSKASTPKKKKSKASTTKNEPEARPKKI